jgi:hemerythrin-like metal-binding protein
MAPSEWRESYRTHVSEIDAQHMAMFDLAAALSEAIKRGEGARALRGAIFTLLEYMRIHIADEEALLRRVEYPDLEKHVREHANFSLTVRKWLEGPTLPEPEEVLAVVEKWLVVHITMSDAAYVPYVLRQSR